MGIDRTKISGSLKKAIDAAEEKSKLNDSVKDSLFNLNDGKKSLANSYYSGSPLGRMNKTETAFFNMLKLRLKLGEISGIFYEPFKLRLADNTFYIPDFVVVELDRTLTIYEVKGYWTDKARVKTKVAASLYWIFRFVAAKKDGRKWEYEYFNRSKN